MEYQILSFKKEDTLQLGHLLAASLPNGAVVCLCGDLGAGKTTLVRGVAQCLDIEEVVQSPTFNIMKIYLKGKRPLIHIDAYRLMDMNPNIGLDEYIGYETGITMIEWPQYIESLIPDNHITITIKNLGEDKRNIVVDSPIFIEGLDK